MLQNPTKTLLESWSLSEKAVSILSNEPEIVSDLALLRSLLPLPASLEVQTFEVRFDDLTYIRIEKDKQPYVRDCELSYQPPFTEYLVNGETVLFHVKGEVVVDRSQNLDLSHFQNLIQKAIPQS